MIQAEGLLGKVNEAYLATKSMEGSEVDEKLDITPIIAEYKNVFWNIKKPH